MWVSKIELEQTNTKELYFYVLLTKVTEKELKKLKRKSRMRD